MPTKKQREQILAKSDGKCWYCGCELLKGWHCDHLEPVFRVKKMSPNNTPRFGSVPDRIKKMMDEGMQKPENDTLDNMVPACAPCNLFKNTLSVEQFRNEILQQVQRGRRSSVNFRTAERFGLIEAIDKPIVFYFETLNKQQGNS